MSEDSPSFIVAVRDTMTALVASLPSGTATIEEVDGGSGTYFITVLPRRAGAAAIRLHIAEPIVDFSFGEYNTFEFDDEDAMEKVRQWSEAVIEGRCGVTLGLIARQSWVQPDPNGKKLRGYFLFYPRLFPKKLRYLPYLDKNVSMLS